MYRNFFLILAIGIWAPSIAQVNTKLYMPLEFQRAYRNVTRSSDGKPGLKYWQNRSDYSIKAKIDPIQKILDGHENITYSNNSPDTLRLIEVFLYHDVYSKRASRDSDINPDLLTDGVIIQSIGIDNRPVDIRDESRIYRTGTRMFLYLEKPLIPHSSIQLHIDWSYMIPGEGFDRSGAFDSTSMFIAYWYPEIAVYDDIDGWDRIDFTGGVEFYHDYSNYEVEIEAPGNFLLWASGPPLNPGEVYPDFIMERLSQVNENKSTSIVSREDINRGIQVKTNTWKYKVENFDDFCFALSDHYQWDARLYKNNETYFLNTVYPVYHDKFSVVSDIETEALEVFTNKMPAYPFPFKYFTAFNGLVGGGMEFPGMINDTFADTTEYRRPITNLEANRGLTYHEMFHMYFPFYMGINEKKYSWMDEGWATFTDYYSSRKHYYYNLSWLGSLSIAPMMVPSNTTPRSFYPNSYTIASYSYYSLQQLLGEDLFNQCLHVYFDRWNHKHPSPYDFFNTFTDASGQDLNWFWKKWYFDWGYIDLGIRGYDGKSLEIENPGGRPVAARVKLLYTDRSTEELIINPRVWKDSSIFLLTLSKKKKLSQAELLIPTSGDALKENNLFIVK